MYNNHSRGNMSAGILIHYPITPNRYVQRVCSVSTTQRFVSKCMHPNGHCLPVMAFVGDLFQLCLTLMNSVYSLINTSFTENTGFDNWKLFFCRKYYHVLDSIQIRAICMNLSGMEKHTLIYSLESSHKDSSRCTDLKITIYSFQKCWRDWMWGQ